jgi:hypothetical protein
MSPTRRELLVAAGGAVLLAACGGNSSKGTGATSDGGGTLPPHFAVVQRFPSSGLFVPGAVRLPVSISDGSNVVGTGPATVSGWVEDFKKNKVADVTGKLRDQGVSMPYWEVRANLPKAVVYTLRLHGDDGYGATFELSDPSQVQSPLTGKSMPPFDTPTVDNHRGVEPYCSLLPKPCPLHDVTLTQALKTGKPVAYIVGTPAHCQTGTCAPGLAALVDEHSRLGDKVVMVHADVYADAAATTVAPAVDALHVDYEPIIYFCDTKGVVVDRLDGVWDTTELRERLDLLLA